MTAQLDILLVRRWTHDSARIRTSLRAAGLTARIARVDFPAALYAALVRTRFDFVLYDPETTAIPRELLSSSLREHDQSAPVLVLGDDEVGPVIAAQLQQRRN